MQMNYEAASGLSEATVGLAAQQSCIGKMRSSKRNLTPNARSASLPLFVRRPIHRYMKTATTPLSSPTLLPLPGRT